MRSIWKGAIAFGLVSIPVKLYLATEDRGVDLHQVHDHDGGRVRQRRFCERCGKEVPYEQVARGYQSEDGRTVVLTDADMAELPLPSKNLIDVLAFVDLAGIDPVSLDRSYYIGADPAGAKPYALLRDALAASGRAAVTKIALRTRESLALLRVQDDTLVLQTMHWPEEVRSPVGLAPTENVTVRPQELRMAASLMDTLSEDFDLSALHDDYQHALDELVEAKLEGKHVTAPAEPAAEAEVIDLMDALKASIDRTARAGRKAADEGGKGGGGRGAAAKKTAETKEKAAETGEKAAGSRKKTAGKKATPKKTAARKAASRRAAS